MVSNRIGVVVCVGVVAGFCPACSDRSSLPTSPSVNGAIAGAVTSASGAPASISPASGPAPKQSTANFEIKFMEDMIDHHAMAVEMAQMCLEKAVHAELRSLCQNIIDTQSAEMQQMESWLQSWYGVSYAPTMKNGDQKMLERMAALSGAEFEIMFMEMMIKHHEKAIQMARSCVDKAFHDRLISLCESIIPSQSAEVQQLQTWLCQWYGECR